MSYNPAFIPDVEIPLPELGEALLPSAFDGGQPVEHERFSIIFNQDRGFAFVTAHNIDGATIIPAGQIPRKGFRFDPDVPNDIQVDNERGYLHNPWDRGHLVRRRSLHWGDLDDAEVADRQSSFWTNIAPQHETLHDTAWGDIEDFIFEVADGRRASVFQGPVLTQHDPVHQNGADEVPIRIPAGFWKIVLIEHQERLRAAAFLVWQRDFDKPEPESFDPVLEQVRVTTIEFLTGLSFPQVVRDADPFHFSEEGEIEAEAAAIPGRVVPALRAAARRARPPVTRPAFILSAEDIRL